LRFFYYQSLILPQQKPFDHQHPGLTGFCLGDELLFAWLGVVGGITYFKRSDRVMSGALLSALSRLIPF
jgi:hypothetical protein